MPDQGNAALLLFGVVIPLLWAATLLLQLWLQRKRRRRTNDTPESSLLHTRFKAGGTE